MFALSYNCPHFCWRIVKLLLNIFLLLHCMTTTRSGGSVTASSPYEDTALNFEQCPREINIGIGDSANITCRIFNNGNSSIFYFHIPDTNQTIYQPNDNIILLDAQSAVYRIRNATEQNRAYVCMNGTQALGETRVRVGTKPKNVTDFGCLVYYYNYMTCNFTTPPNNLLTDYSLQYDVNDAPMLPPQNKPCNLTKGNNNVMTCVMLSGNYLQSHQHYKFNLTAKNTLDSLTQIFYINCSDIVIPARVPVEIVDIQSDKVTLHWQIENNFNLYIKHSHGLGYEITIKLNDTHSIEKMEFCETQDCHIDKLGSLPYAHYEYEVKVRAKANSTGNRGLWSDPFIGRFTTLPARPYRAPITVKNAFYNTANETRLYWQALKPFEYNGEDFFYAIEDIDRPSLFNQTTTHTTIGVPKHEATYRIRSQNAVGYSPNYSVIRVCSLTDMSDFADSISSILYANNTHMVTWRQPDNNDELTNYTVFWCDAPMQSPFDCQGNLNFETVDKNQTSYIARKLERVSFAVAANYGKCSTGMQWVKCSAVATRDLPKLQHDVRAVNSTAIEISWSLQGVCPSLLTHYQVDYCEYDTAMFKCIAETQQEVQFQPISNGITLKQYTIGNLKPYTVYRMEMRMFSELKSSQSTAENVMTGEGVPSAPRSLRLIESSITNSSVNLTWLPPVIANGRLREYIIYTKTIKKYGHDVPGSKFIEVARVENSAKMVDTPIVFQLRDRRSYSKYAVIVKARTTNVSISAPSNAINFTTSIGRPSSPRNVEWKNDGDYRVLTWSEPELASGQINFYEVALYRHFADNTEILASSIVTKASLNRCRHRAPDCINSMYEFSIKVRAVNINYGVKTKNNTQNAIITEPSLGGGERSRRNTNPEINHTFVSSAQLFDFADTERHVRHDGHTTTTTTSTTTTTAATPTVSQATRNGQQNVDVHEFKCEDESSIFMDHLKVLKSKEEFLYSPWQDASTSVQCKEATQNVVLQIFISLIVLVVLIVFILLVIRPLYKKLNKMKNIEVVLPAGMDYMPNCKYDNDVFANLTDLDEANRAKSLEAENSAITRNIDYYRFKSTTEDAHLLNATHDGSLNALQSLTPSSSACSKDSYDEHLEQHRMGAAIQNTIELTGAPHEDQSNSESTDSVELNDVSNNSSWNHAAMSTLDKPMDNSYYKLQSVTAKKDHDGYVIPNGFQKCPASLTSTTTTQAQNNHAAAVMMPVSSSGYVQPNALNIIAEQHQQQQQQQSNHYQQQNNEEEEETKETLQQQQPKVAAAVADGYATLDSLTAAAAASATSSFSIPTTTNNTTTTLDNIPYTLTTPNVDVSTKKPTHSTTNKFNEPDMNATTTTFDLLSLSNNNKLSNGYVTQRQLSELGQLLH